MKVGDIMSKESRTLSPDTSVREAVQILLSLKRGGLVVVDASEKVVGVFTEKDILKNILPSYIAAIGSFAYANAPGSIRHKISKIRDQKVGDLMQRRVVSVLGDTSVFEAAHLMVTENVHYLPVVDKEGRLAGVVSRTDVLTCVLKSE